jgi:hypothetical protein
MVGGKYFGNSKRNPVKPPVYKRPEELHPRIELTNTDMTLARREPSGVVEVNEYE